MKTVAAALLLRLKTVSVASVRGNLTFFKTGAKPHCKLRRLVVLRMLLPCSRSTEDGLQRNDRCIGRIKICVLDYLKLEGQATNFASKPKNSEAESCLHFTVKLRASSMHYKNDEDWRLLGEIFWDCTPAVSV